MEIITDEHKMLDLNKICELICFKYEKKSDNKNQINTSIRRSSSNMIGSLKNFQNIEIPSVELVKSTFNILL
jgi:hypothetical protein